MKKAVALFLALVMCLSLAACGSNDNIGENSTSAEKAIIGVWNFKGRVDVFVFSDDGKVAHGDNQYDWWYDKSTDRYNLSIKGLTYTFVLEEDENGRFFTLGNSQLDYIENYDPATLEAKYIKDKVASLTKGKTELIVGNSYTTANGIEFTLEKAELDQGWFVLYIASENALEFGSATYDSWGGQSGFGFGLQEGGEGNTRRYTGCSFQSISSLEADKDKFGFLSFDIDGTAYCVSIESFFE